MRILHYSLGFPPYRTGGLTKFCMDLMQQQAFEGDKVSLLWPGEIRSFSMINNIKRHRNNNNIGSFEITNPLPISYDEGIRDFEAFMKSGNIEPYDELLKKIRPDDIHIHTLMGIHKSFLEAAKKREIRLVFTAHDFFPICPKVTLFRNGHICTSAGKCSECGECNSTALSLKKIQALQSPVYRLLKDSIIIKKMRKRHRDMFLSTNKILENVCVGVAEDYKKLREYYYSLIQKMDIVHYNSTVTKKVYDELFVIPNNGIKPALMLKNYWPHMIRILEIFVLRRFLLCFPRILS